MAPDLVDQLADAVDLMEALIAKIRDGQWDAATPCPGWTVRQLVNHLVAGQWLFAAALSGRPVPREEASRRHGVDQLGDRPVEAFRASADEMLAAFRRPGVLRQTVSVPFGEVPGAVAGHLRLTETLVHGWDLARATGRTVSVPASVAQQELEFSRDALASVPRDGGPFAPPQPVPDDAPALDRLAALLGRSVTG